MSSTTTQSADLTPGVSLTETDNGPRAVVTGRWTAAQLTVREVWASVVSALQTVPAGTRVWDLRSVQGLDHLGAQLLWNKWERAWPADVQFIPGQRAVIERVARYSTAPPAMIRTTWWGRFDALGARVLHAMGHAYDVTRLVGQLLIDLVKLAMRPREGPWRDMSGHLYRIGATALPITALVGFLIGVVLAYLTSLQLKQFGADAFIGSNSALVAPVKIGDRAVVGAGSVVTRDVPADAMAVTRAEEKRELLARHQAQRLAAPVGIDELERLPDPAYVRVQLHGRFDARHSLLLDNRIRGGQAACDVDLGFKVDV